MLLLLLLLLLLFYPWYSVPKGAWKLTNQYKGGYDIIINAADDVSVKSESQARMVWCFVSVASVYHKHTLYQQCTCLVFELP